MQWLDMDTWSRKPLVEKYAGYVFPYINIGAEVEVTRYEDGGVPAENHYLVTAAFITF